MTIALRPYLPSDAATLARIFRDSILELTGEDYSVGQQNEWAAEADDEAGFAARLGRSLTLVALSGGSIAGFASLKEDSLDLLYVDPQAAGQGVAKGLLDALERLAAARGIRKLTVDASDTALGFFEKRGYKPQRRNTVAIGAEWLGNTTMTKTLGPAQPAGTLQ